MDYDYIFHRLVGSDIQLTLRLRESSHESGHPFWNNVKNKSLQILAASAALLILAVGFIVLLVADRRKIGTVQRKHAVELQALEQKYSNRYDNTPIGMVRVSLDDWTLLEMNEEFRKIAGRIPLKAGEDFLRCLPATDQSVLKAELYDNGSVRHFETHVGCADGTTIWLSFSGRVHSSEGYIEGIVGDVTACAKTEEKLREQAAFLEKTHDAIVILSPDNIVRFWNPGAERLFVWTASEATGRPLTELIYNEQQIPAFRKRRDELFLNGDWSGEINQVRKDGSQVVSSSRWTLVLDPENRPKSILEIHTDITERKLLESKFLRIQRLESLGVLAGGIAHNLNNVLAPIILSIQTLKKKWDENASRNHLATLETSVQKGAELVRQVLTFARGVEGQRVPVRLEKLVSEVLKATSHTFPRSVELESAIASDLWPAIGDASQILQILTNLCINAGDAMPGGGRLSISAENVVIDDSFVMKNPEAKPGVYVLVQVTDTGKGIPAAELDKIFEPFYTTKSLGRGTGLGLSTTLGIVKSHQGFILVESRLGVGTSLKIYLPAQIYTTTEDAQRKPAM